MMGKQAVDVALREAAKAGDERAMKAALASGASKRRERAGRGLWGRDGIDVGKLARA